MKELGNADMYVQGLRFNSNGQNFAVFGEIDYAIYTSRGFKSIGYGAGGDGVDLVWSKGEIYAIKNGNTVKIIKGSTEISSFKLGLSCDAIFGGEYL